VPQEKKDVANPFKYSKDEMLQVWKDGGGRGALGLEVELWEGVVKELGGEPVGLKEMSEAEKKVSTLRSLLINLLKYPSPLPLTLFCPTRFFFSFRTHVVVFSFYQFRFTSPPVA
jgi:hypothetical protein